MVFVVNGKKKWSFSATIDAKKFAKMTHFKTCLREIRLSTVANIFYDLHRKIFTKHVLKLEYFRAVTKLCEIREL